MQQRRLPIKNRAGLSLAQAMDEFQSAHQQMLQALDTLNDQDLYRPYSSYVPDGSSRRSEPVINWIIGNTYEHFEHQNYIRAQLRER